MEMYDEDLTINIFFKYLQTENPKLYDIAQTRRWMICVPRNGCMDRKQFSDEDFENHILCQEEEQDSNQYVTVNKKRLTIQNNIITTGKGFAEKRVIPIIFEETFFNKDEKGYQVLCINQPLEGTYVNNEENHGKQVQSTLHHLHDCAAVLWKNNENVKVGQALQDQIEQFSENMYNIWQCSLAQHVVATKSLYTKCLHIVMKDQKLKKRCQTESGYHDTIKVALESYMLHNVYRKLFINICTCVAEKDAKLNQITRNLRDLQLKDLDVRAEFCQNVPKARKELGNLPRYYTPLGKLLCIKRVFRVLMQQPYTSSAADSSSVMPLTTDDLLPMAMFLIVKAEESHWWATFSYITQFRFSKSCNDDEYGFFLATIEAALEHILANQLGQYLQSRISKEMTLNFLPMKMNTLFIQEEQQTSCLNQYFHCIIMNDLNGMCEKLQQIHSPILDTSLLCHPLCICEKCQRIISVRKETENEIRVSVNSVDDKGWTGMHMAAYFGHVEMLDWFYQQGVDVNVVDLQGNTPLHLACKAGKQKSTLLMLHYGAKCNIQDNENNTPLHVATLHGYEDCVKALVYYDQGNTPLNLDIRNDFGDTALHLASKWGYLSICEILIENGADVEIRNRKNKTSLDVKHNINIGHLFQFTFAKIIANFKSPQRDSLQKYSQRRSSVPGSFKPQTQKISRQRQLLINKHIAKVEKLLKAVLNHDVQMVKFYLGWNESDSDCESEDEEIIQGRLCHPLCQCSKCAPLQRLKNPVSKDLHVNCTNGDGMSVLHMAAQCGYTNLATMFLRRGALVNKATATDGYTPLHLAIKNQATEVAVLLLRNGADVNIADVLGNTAAHHAAVCLKTSILRALLIHGCKRDVQNTKGNTPLHESAKAGLVTCVQILLEYGACVNITNHENKIPIELSQKDSIHIVLSQYRSTTSLHSLSSREKKASLPSNSASMNPVDSKTSNTSAQSSSKLPKSEFNFEKHQRSSSLLVHSHTFDSVCGGHLGLNVTPETTDIETFSVISDTSEEITSSSGGLSHVESPVHSQAVLSTEQTLNTQIQSPDINMIIAQSKMKPDKSALENKWPISSIETESNTENTVNITEETSSVISTDCHPSHSAYITGSNTSLTNKMPNHIESKLKQQLNTDQHLFFQNEYFGSDELTNNDDSRVIDPCFSIENQSQHFYSDIKIPADKYVEKKESDKSKDMEAKTKELDSLSEDSRTESEKDMPVIDS